MSTAFADADLQRIFERDGFATFPLLNAATVSRLQNRFDELGVPDDHEFFVSVAHLDRSAARATDLELKQILEPLLRELLPDHEAFTATFISKGARSGTPTEFHQDLTYCDERQNRALIVWISLIDLDETIGAMECVPGSHRWTSGIRPHGSGALPTEHWQPHFADRATTVPLAAGSAAVWDPATVHGAKPYTGNRTRTAVAIGLLPTGTKMLHFYRDGAEEPDGFRVDESFFATHPFRTRPTGDPDVTSWAPAVRAVDFLPYVGSATTSTAGPAPARQRIFCDERIDDTMRRDGGATTHQLISAGDAAALREEYGRLHGWSGSGFEADIDNEDRSYRREVSALLADALDAKVEALFEHYTPWLRVFLCKWPGAGPLYLHRDWTYVDERAGARTFVVWIPLQDVNEENGALQILPRSHLLDWQPRGTNLNAPWVQSEDIIRPRLVDMPARAGQAVIMDNSVVHSSTPNRSDQPRVIAAIGMGPIEAPLVHLRRNGERGAFKYFVGRDFFLTCTPDELKASPPDLPPAEELTDVNLDMVRSDSDLALRLDELRTTPGSGSDEPTTQGD